MSKAFFQTEKHMQRAETTPRLNSIYSIHLWKLLEWSSLPCVTSVVALMINDVREGFRWNFSLKSRYFLQFVQTKTNCSAGLPITDNCFDNECWETMKASHWLMMPCICSESYMAFRRSPEGDLKVGVLPYLYVYPHVYRCVTASFPWLLLSAQHFRSSSALNFAHDMPWQGHRAVCFPTLLWQLLLWRTVKAATKRGSWWLKKTPVYLSCGHMIVNLISIDLIS